MPDPVNEPGSKAAIQAASELVGVYHKEQLGLLLDHVRSGFVRLDSGGIDEFELDDLIFHYKRTAAELWKFCESTRASAEQVARMLSELEDRGDELDWWEKGRLLSRDERRSARQGR